MVDRAIDDDPGDDTGIVLHVSRPQHVDGTMGVHERNNHLAWLKDDTPDDVCRILTNARCLSEGVDVPALDAVHVPDAARLAGRRRAVRGPRHAQGTGKELGYIILPVVVPSGMAPEDALRDNQRYKVVWQVLQALRSHDDRFHAMVNQIELNKGKTDRLVIDNVTPRPEIETPARRSKQRRPEQSHDEQLAPVLRHRRLPRRDVRPDRPEGRRAQVLGDVGLRRRRHRPGAHRPHQRRC